MQLQATLNQRGLVTNMASFIQKKLANYNSDSGINPFLHSY